MRGGGNDRPEWTADGRRVGYASSRSQGFWWQPVDGSATPTQLQAAADPIREGVFTRDGSALVYRTDNPANSRDIWLRRLTGDSTPVPLLVTLNDDKQPRPSPDSRWLAYVSNESGVDQVYEPRQGGTFLVSMPDEQDTANQLHVIVNWASELSTRQ